MDTPSNTTQTYNLTLMAFDGKHISSCVVLVQVTKKFNYECLKVNSCKQNGNQIQDVNDNAPRFDWPVYNVTEVDEHEEGVSENNPRYLLTVCFDSFDE